MSTNDSLNETLDAKSATLPTRQAKMNDLNLMETVVYTGSSSTGVIHRRLLTKIDGPWVEWEPVGYKPTQPFRRMRLSSFKTWILNYERSLSQGVGATATLETNNRFVVMPNEINVHNACNDRCDMAEGPCSCGAWHRLEDWDETLGLSHSVASTTAKTSIQK